MGSSTDTISALDASPIASAMPWCSIVQWHVSPRLQALQLPRLTLYRLFEHEGGLGAYIRNRRLREAADELVKFPNLPVMDIAYGRGFKSASDFTPAFRRTYEIAPQDLRFIALER